MSGSGGARSFRSGPFERVDAPEEALRALRITVRDRPRAWRSGEIGNLVQLRFPVDLDQLDEAVSRCR